MTWSMEELKAEHKRLDEGLKEIENTMPENFDEDALDGLEDDIEGYIQYLEDVLASFKNLEARIDRIKHIMFR